jgi:para-nitrobenzyl esterase
MTSVMTASGGAARLALADGLIEGRLEAGVRRFLSVPYAAPLTQERRFREPQPVEPWTGVRDATRPGPSAPQNVSAIAGLDWAELIGDVSRTGPDYLTLNVWAPDAAPAAPRPVMVFVHGGSFVSGGKDGPIYDGTAFARDGIVCVVINYRLAIDGFLPVPGAPTNLGLRDIIAALGWVRTNIAAFGGDADNVTLFGESAGAVCVALLAVSPAAEGLFHRAICQSGHGDMLRDVAQMQPVVRRLARRLGVSPDRDGFASIPADEMLAAQASTMKRSLWRDLRRARRVDFAAGARFAPVIGDDIVPERPFTAQAKGAGKSIDLLTGTTAEEANLFLVPGGLRERLKTWQALLLLRPAVPRPLRVLRAYGLGQRGVTPGQALGRAMSDLMFRWPCRREAMLRHGRTWVYDFDWRSPALGGELGAAHAVELPFVFDTLRAASGPKGLLGPDPPQALADSIHAVWVKFAATGEAPWPPYDAFMRMVYSLSHGEARTEAPPIAARFAD